MTIFFQHVLLIIKEVALKFLDENSIATPQDMKSKYSPFLQKVNHFESNNVRVCQYDLEKQKQQV